MKTPQGFTLIEVLISLLLLSIMLFGLDAMQITSLRQMKEAYFFAVATQQISVITEQLLLDKAKNLEKDMRQWNKQNTEVLPQGQGVVSGACPQYTISLFWGEKHGNSCEKNMMGQNGCIKRNVLIAS